ncbi:MAG: membrane protein insertion efficiency factor YidD [Synergistaceae bacterium]|nr:membrane protein insertion efficiency factor YidD [Synergistaceae bacterium]
MAWRGLALAARAAVGALILLIRVYQVCVSPLLGSRCRFYPSCSEYAAVALREHGLFAGLRLAVLRLLRCGPWHEGGYDPVPGPGQGQGQGKTLRLNMP